MKRAASSEWPPRSVKKSASKGMACGGSTRLAASSSAASVSLRGSSCSSSGIGRGECQSASGPCGRSCRRPVAAGSRRTRNAPEPCRPAGFARSSLRKARASISRVQRGNHERDELFDVVIVAQDDGGMRNAGETGELCLDLAQFDAKAANLDLIVDPAMEHDFAVRASISPRRRSGTRPDRGASFENGLAMNFSAVSRSRRK